MAVTFEDVSEYFEGRNDDSWDALDSSDAEAAFEAAKDYFEVYWCMHDDADEDDEKLVKALAVLSKLATASDLIGGDPGAIRQYYMQNSLLVIYQSGNKSEWQNRMEYLRMLLRGIAYPCNIDGVGFRLVK